MDTAIEAKLGVGLVRNKEYIALYLNLTAWSISATSNVIPLSLRDGFKMISLLTIVLVRSIH